MKKGVISCINKSVMDELASAISSLIDTNKRFVIATRTHARRDILLAREALRFALEIKGAKTISLPALTDMFTSEWKAILPPQSAHSIPSKILISLPKEKVGEIRYEEQTDKTVFVITPKNAIREQEISIREELPEVDAAFFFFPYEDSSRNEVTKRVSLPSKDKMVFFLENEKTLAEKIYTLTQSIAFRPEEESLWATLLYASLILETDNFKRKISPRIFNLAERLLERRAHTDAVSQEEEKGHEGSRNLSYAQILGRALARTQVDEGTNSSWTFLTQKDFQKSGIHTDKKEGAVQDVLAYIERIVPRVETSFLLWEGLNISCIIKSKDKKFIGQCARTESFSCTDTACRGENFSTFTHAELKIRELLKEAKYDTIM